MYIRRNNWSSINRNKHSYVNMEKNHRKNEGNWCWYFWKKRKLLYFSAIENKNLHRKREGNNEQ